MAENENQKNGAPAASANSLDEPEQFRKLFIGGLSLNTNDDALKEFYGKFGNILDSVVMRDSLNKKSRGFGFVTYSSKAEVDSAMSNRPHVIDGKTVDPKRAVPRDQSSRGEANVSTQRLYVSGVREDHTEDHFKNYFNDFGNVTKVEIITDKSTGKPRGFGFITFDDYDSVDKCVLAKSHNINGHRCDVKKALSRDEMAKAQQHDRDRMERGNRSRGRGGAQGSFRNNSGPSGSFREPRGGYGGAPPYGFDPSWQGQGQWGGGYGGPPDSYGPPGSNWGGNMYGQQSGYQQGGWSGQPGGSYQSGPQSQWSSNNSGGSGGGSSGGGNWKGTRY